jgi:beta-N-acetylhexosaminidase
MVDLTAKPYYLKAADIRWVEDTIAGMSLEEKVGQLFVGIAAPGRKDENRRMLERYHVGGARYNPGSARAVQDTNRFMQEHTKIPLLIPSNTEAGGEGVCAEGTLVAPGVMCGATGDPSVSYEMGRVAAIESAAAGCNWCFAPVVDIAYNWRNTVIQTTLTWCWRTAKRSCGRPPSRA